MDFNDYTVTYEVEKSKGFNDLSQLKDFLNCLFRTDITQMWTSPLTRCNLYLLRNADRELEFFCNVVRADQRIQLQHLVLDYVKDIPLNSLRNDIISVSPNIPKGDLLDYFTELTTGYLPGLWKDQQQTDFPFGSSLDDTVCFVLLADHTNAGNSLPVHVHRLFITKSINDMPNKNFYYCKGVGCPMRERCVRFKEGESLPEGNWLWQFDCGDEHRDFLPAK